MIQQTEVRVVYKGDGVTKEFPINFPVLDKKFVIVALSDKNGNEKTLNKDYYVDMDKGVVIYPGYIKGQEPAEAEQPPALQTGEKIVIYRNTQVSQLVSLGRKWPFEVCEKALDKLTMIEQENKELITRTVRLPEAIENVGVILPPPRKNSAIGWSEDEKKVINVPVKQWQEEAHQHSMEAAIIEENVKKLQKEVKEQVEIARKWSEDKMSPDNQDDKESITGKTRSSKSWAMEAKAEADKALTNSEKADKAKGAAEERAKEARTAANEAKKALETVTGGVDLSEYAKKEELAEMASVRYVDNKFTDLIGKSVKPLDTLEKIGKSLKNDADFAGTMEKRLLKKADKENVYEKTESDKKYQPKGDYATKDEAKYSPATAERDGIMTAADKKKLDGIQEKATAGIDSEAVKQIISGYMGNTTPELTPLIDWSKAKNVSKNERTGVSGTGAGDIPLKRSYKEFDALFFVVTNDNKDRMTCGFSPMWMFDFLMNQNANVTFGIPLFDNDLVWLLYGKNKGSTDMLLKHNDDNSTVVEIYGVKYTRETTT